MPWSDKEEKKTGEQNKKTSPWGNSYNKNDNNIENLFHDGRKHFFNFFKSGKNKNKIFLAIVSLLFLFIFSGFYNVSQEEQAVVLRFGKFKRLAQPGLNYHLPSPIEKVISLKVDRIEEEQVGFRDVQSGSRSSFREIPEESLMLTGDENIINIQYTVQWNITDVKKYIFNLLKPKETVKNVAESAMREVIGSTPIVSAFEERANIERNAKNLIQDILDSYNAGITITNFSIKNADPPNEVSDAFRDVQTALSDKEREINQAQAYQNDIIPRARGEASKIIQEAEGYKQTIVSLATGEVSRFDAIYNKYVNAKTVTKQRLYLETMEDVLQNIDKVILDKSLEKSLLPYLPLPSTPFK